MRIVLLATLILGLGVAPGLSFAGSNLPAGLSFCQPSAEVLAKLPSAREMSDDVYDATLTVWGVEGFVSAIMDNDRLVGMRFRAFETPADLKKIRSRLHKAYGEGGTRGSATIWAAGPGVRAELKLQSEQIFVGWETAPGHCGTEVIQKGLSEQEKKDADSLKARKAVNWDPYADDVEGDAVKKKAKQRKEQKEQPKEEKKEEPSLGDDEIDW
tara:strand:+ start:527 stop:1165 length:639 start_codon:yes stop_codon:yes gene_type:complete